MFCIITVIGKLTVLIAQCNVGIPGLKLIWTLCPVELNTQKEKVTVEI